MRGVYKITLSDDGIITSDKYGYQIMKLLKEEVELIFKSVNEFLSEYVGILTGDRLPIINFNK
jgi:hypothetical protein